jgi:hypothetical protein
LERSGRRAAIGWQRFVTFLYVFTGGSIAVRSAADLQKVKGYLYFYFLFCFGQMPNREQLSQARAVSHDASAAR